MLEFYRVCCIYICRCFGKWKKKKKLRGEWLIENRVKFKRLEINEKKKKWNLKDLIENISKLEGVICNCSLIFVYEALVF